MKALDKLPILLQFKIKIYEKNGSEFQRFFERVMEKAYSDFKRIKPYGRDGDAGNDGYCKKRGVYYQIYAPNQPIIKEAEAARKLRHDFQKLKKNWDEISKIKEYYFVYNNKYTGSTKDIEAAISVLEKENPGILFDTFLVKDFEDTFFKLDVTDILDLGFNVNLTEAVANAYKYLEKVEIQLDRENADFAYKILENIHDIITALDNDLLELEYKILECRCLQKLERINEAKLKYENIAAQYPNDLRALLYLSEVHLLNNNLKKNKDLLDQVEAIDKDNWLLKLEKLIRTLGIKEKVDIANISEQHFPDEHRMKANFYRLYSIALHESGNLPMANSFIEKAITLNPDKLVNYIIKISFKVKEIYDNRDQFDQQDLFTLLKEIEDVEKRFCEIRPRIKVMLNLRKLAIFLAQKNYDEFAMLSQQTLEMIYNCFYDTQIDQMLIQLLPYVKLADQELDKLTSYIITSNKEISDDLAKILIIQFASRTGFVNLSKEFFTKIHKQQYINFINNIENKNYDKVVSHLQNDIHLALGLAGTLKDFPDLRKRIIGNLPEDKDIQKDQLLLLLNYDKQDFDEAFEIIKKIDLTKVDYLECKPILEIAREKRAWDFMICVSEKILEHEKNDEFRLFLKLNIFHANFSLGKLPEVIKIGNEILEEHFSSKLLNFEDKEYILARTIIAHLMRGEFGAAKKILITHRLPNHSYRYKITIEAEVYLTNNEPDLALNSVVEGVKMKRTLSPEEYARLYFLVGIKIRNLLDLKLESLKEIKEDSFVKFKDETKWYYVGDGNSLDAFPIVKTNEKFSLLNRKKVNDTIIFESEYSKTKQTKIIEKIFTPELYILWQSAEYFHQLAQDNLLDGIQRVEVPEKEGRLDLSFLKAYLRDLHQKPKAAFDFEMYCQKNLPLAMLSISEGSFQHALRRIQYEGKGYVNCSVGTASDLTRQEAIIKDIIDKKREFYIDGSSAFMLLESNLLKDIYTHLPSMKIPQSVINLFYKIAEERRYKPGQKGYMHYYQDKISILPIDKEKEDHIQSIIKENIQYFESNPQNIGVISLASKSDFPSEKLVPAECSDACILSQKENTYILTEDYLYLKWNELETNKKTPEHFSSIVLLKILYERKLINFGKYLDYFEFLSLFRFRFLAFSHTDIIKAVFGDAKIMTVTPQKIRKLNFPLTLSEEYGVPFETAFAVVFKFLIYVLTNDAILPEIAEKVFVEIIEYFPSKIDKKELGQLFLNVGKYLVNKNVSRYIITPKSKVTMAKIDRLLEIAKVYDFNVRLWKPKKEE